MILKHKKQQSKYIVFTVVQKNQNDSKQGDKNKKNGGGWGVFCVRHLGDLVGVTFKYMCSKQKKKKLKWNHATYFDTNKQYSELGSRFFIWPKYARGRKAWQSFHKVSWEQCTVTRSLFTEVLHILLLPFYLSNVLTQISQFFLPFHFLPHLSPTAPQIRTGSVWAGGSHP